MLTYYLHIMLDNSLNITESFILRVHEIVIISKQNSLYKQFY